MIDTPVLYKLIVLFLLNEVDVPLHNGQITEFILDKEYTDYLTLQQAMLELIDAKLIDVEETKNSTFYRVSQSGRDALECYKQDISKEIKEDVKEYIKSKKLDLIEAASIVTDYYEKETGDFLVNCKIREKDRILMNLSLTVDSKEQAKKVCENFKLKNNEVYIKLINELFD